MDIATLASYARTALDNPAAYPMPKGSAAGQLLSSGPLVGRAIQHLDEIIAACEKLQSEHDHWATRYERLMTLNQADPMRRDDWSDIEYADGVRYGLDIALQNID